MLRTLATLLVFQSIGEMLAHGFGLPFPGPVIGMALLFIYLLGRSDEAERLKGTSLELLRHLSLLFVPAGVGIMLHAARLERDWLPILMALVGSTALTIVVTALVVRWVYRRLDKSST